MTHRPSHFVTRFVMCLATLAACTRTSTESLRTVAPAAAMPASAAAAASDAAVPPVGERLTTPELAELLGVGRSALNNWISRNQPGAERDGWRLVDRVRPAAGGPPQWTWERATT